MSKRNNVNPDYYKVAGRERPGESAAAKAPKQPQAMNKERERFLKRRPHPTVRPATEKPTEK